MAEAQLAVPSGAVAASQLIRTVMSYRRQTCGSLYSVKHPQFPQRNRTFRYSDNYDWDYGDVATGDAATAELGLSGWVIRKDT